MSTPDQLLSVALHGTAMRFLEDREQGLDLGWRVHTHALRAVFAALVRGSSPTRARHPVAVCAWSALPRSCVARRPLERVVGHLLPARLAPSEV
jgi:hypothetical protein